MEAFVEELYELSPNEDLFRSLLGGEELPEAGEQPSGNDTNDATKKLLYETRIHLLAFLQQSSSQGEEDKKSGLNDFIEQSNDNEKVIIFGECILALLASNNNNQRKVLRNIILQSFPKVRPNKEILIRAKREWLFIYFEELISKSRETNAEEMLNLCYAIAGCTNNMRPGLVGQSFVHLGRVAQQAAGDMTKARQCFEAVEMDLYGNLIKHESISKNLRFELKGMMYWYKQACQELMKMDNSTTTRLEQVQNCFSEAEQKFEPPSHNAMIGPIAQVYLSRRDYLKKVLREIRTVDDGGLDSICYRYDYCHEIDTILFALERHALVLPLIPAGVQMVYEPDVQEVLDALKEMDEVVPDQQEESNT